MKQARLEAALRTAQGKSGARRLRREGLVPGVIYGLNKPVSIQCDARAAGALVHALHGGTRLVNLALKNNGASEEKHVLLKAVQVTPVGQHLVHLDFQEVDINKKVQVQVEVRPEGVAEGIKMGGVLQTVTYELLVECLPADIPEFIPVNVESLKIGGSLHVKDIKLPPGVRVMTSPDETVFVVTAPTAVLDEQAAAAAAAAAAAPEAVEGAEAAPAAPGTAPAPGAEKPAAAPAKGPEKAEAKPGKK